ncbi:glycosyltransferase family 4 protein [Desulfobacula phenolica]|uniref:Glycosyltransferase involved in cell wall bisynthesis n=1 Tax=Desulfobacula phenolica TaxID=90732 RepID=A0A1H2DU58_9BACT|nr:glycosyltransferase family 4 protein [Desulfobacula phenolica]SDT86324.1 Glycosyltransferase involved in cell wall bisynthesis [Desulfobacula phenolica]
MKSNISVLIYSSNSKYQKKNIGGAETSLGLIAEKLAERGIKVTYFTNGFLRIPGIRRKKINGVDVYFFTPWRWPTFNNKFLSLLASKLIRKQKQTALYRLIKKNSINVVHTYDAFPETFDIIEIRRKYNLQFKIMMRVAGLHWAYQMENHLVKPATIEYVFKNIDIINLLDIGFKKLFNEKCKQFGINLVNPKLFIHDIGVDCKFYKDRKKQPENNNFTIVCAARFSHIAKRQDLLIEAIKKIKNHNVHVKFLGDGSLLKKYKKQIDSFSLGHLAQFYGYVSKERLKAITETADLVALPTDYEGVSKSVIEAMAMKLPVLVSDVPALNSFLVHNKTGFLVENTPEKWAEIILKLNKDRKLLCEVAERGYLFTSKTYSADNNIFRFIEVFKQI